MASISRPGSAANLGELRREWDDEKRRIREAGDPESLAWLEKIEREADNGTLFDCPPVLDQLSHHLKRLGVKQ